MSIYKLMDNNTIERNGVIYDYDADFDVYRRRPRSDPPSFGEQFGWVIATLVLIACCYLVTVLK